MQTEKFQPEGKRIMPVRRFTFGLDFLFLHRSPIDFFIYTGLATFKNSYIITKHDNSSYNSCHKTEMIVSLTKHNYIPQSFDKCILSSLFKR